MATKLGRNQRQALVALDREHGWHPGCGWIWENYSETVRLLNTLVKRGLAEVKTRDFGNGRRVYQHYQITAAGKAEIGA